MAMRKHSWLALLAVVLVAPFVTGCDCDEIKSARDIVKVTQTFLEQGIGPDGRGSDLDKWSNACANLPNLGDIILGKKKGADEKVKECKGKTDIQCDSWRIVRSKIGFVGNGVIDLCESYRNLMSEGASPSDVRFRALVLEKAKQVLQAIKVDLYQAGTTIIQNACDDRRERFARGLPELEDASHLNGRQANPRLEHLDPEIRDLLEQGSAATAI